MALGIVQLRVQALQRQAVLVQWPSLCIAGFDRGMPAATRGRDRSLTAEPRLRRLWPHCCQVQPLPGGLGLHHRLRLPGLYAGRQLGLHSLAVGRAQRRLQVQRCVGSGQVAADGRLGWNFPRRLVAGQSGLHRAPHLGSQSHRRLGLQGRVELVISRGNTAASRAQHV